ncbi:MAG TPA: hypothetical protein VNK05_07680 [Chloroflexota bacterium]|jgi:hypothetical protein|nr:hypothetical protein [Chloroflexota bacterium]
MNNVEGMRAPMMNATGPRPGTLRANDAWSPIRPLRSAALPRRTAVEVTPITWAAGAIAFVVIWSLTYLLRQPGVSDVAAQPFSLIGDFALEGAFLALAWLALVVVACLAVLRGAIVISGQD